MAIKAVVLARGLGKRMRQADDTAILNRDQSSVADMGVKAMLPLLSGGRPFLDYVLSALADASYQQVCLVIGPEHQLIQNYYWVSAPPRRVRISFAIQAQPRGTADALLAAEQFTAGEQFLVINSDNYYPISVLDALRTLGEPGAALFERQALIREGNIPAERLSAYAICTVGPDGYLQGVIEKPDPAAIDSRGSNALISMNCWRFGPEIFPACRGISPSARGELELPRAVHLAVTSLGARIRVIACSRGVLDLSYRADIAAVADRLRAIEANP